MPRAPLIAGLVLVADGFGRHIPKGYLYAAMAFSVFVERINLLIRRRSQRKVHPVTLHEEYAAQGDAADQPVAPGCPGAGTSLPLQARDPLLFGTRCVVL